MDVHEQRVRFVVEATQGAQTFRALCAAYEISRPTGYLWLRRYRELGVEGIRERSRKPHRSPERTDPELEQQVVELRQRYPDWGARKLKVLLARAKGRNYRATPSIVFCCVTTWCTIRTGELRPRNALSAASPTNFGRWISKVPKVGRRPWDRCPCWTITAVT